MKTFEYVIAVSAGDIDKANNSLKDLEKIGGKTTKSLEDGFKRVADAQKTNVGQLGAIAGTGKTALMGLSKAFGTVGGSIKAVGAAIKANPLLLLVSIITEIVTAIIDFVKNLQFTIDIMDLVGGAVDYVIGLLKSLTDWLGITSFSEEEAAEKSKTAAAERKEVNDALYSALFTDMENEIKLMQAQGANIEDIEEKQLELARTKAAVAQQSLEDGAKIIAQEILIAKEAGESTVELQKQLIQLQTNAKTAANDLKVLEATVSTARDNRIKADQAAEDEAAKDEAARRKDAAAERKAAEERRLAEEKDFAAEREKARRQIEDLRIAAIEDETERELEQNRVTYERLIADTLANEKLLQSEKDVLIKQFQAAQAAKDADIRKKKTDEEAAAELKKQTTLQELELELRQQRFDAIRQLETGNLEVDLAAAEQRAKEEEALALEKQALELEKLRQQLEAGALTEEEFALRRISLEEKTQDRIDAIREKAAKDRVEMEKKAEDKIKANKEAAANAVLNISDQVLGAIAENLEEGSEAAKGVAIAQTTMATAQSAVEAYKSTVGIPIVGPALAPIAAAAAVAFGIGQIRKIAQTPKSTDGGGGGAATNIQAAVPTQASSTPQLNLFGTAAQTGGDSSQFESTERNQQSTVKAVVSWTDIDAVANNDNNIQSEMQL